MRMEHKAQEIKKAIPDKKSILRNSFRETMGKISRSYPTTIIQLLLVVSLYFGINGMGMEYKDAEIKRAIIDALDIADDNVRLEAVGNYFYTPQFDGRADLNIGSCYALRSEDNKNEVRPEPYCLFHTFDANEWSKYYTQFWQVAAGKVVRIINHDEVANEATKDEYLNAKIAQRMLLDAGNNLYFPRDPKTAPFMYVIAKNKLQAQALANLWVSYFPFSRWQTKLTNQRYLPKSIQSVDDSGIFARQLYQEQLDTLATSAYMDQRKFFTNDGYLKKEYGGEPEPQLEPPTHSINQQNIAQSLFEILLQRSREANKKEREKYTKDKFWKRLPKMIGLYQALTYGSDPELVKSAYRIHDELKNIVALFPRKNLEPLPPTPSLNANTWYYNLVKNMAYGFGLSGLAQLLLFESRDISLSNALCLYGTMGLFAGSGSYACYMKAQDRSLQIQKGKKSKKVERRNAGKARYNKQLDTAQEAIADFKKKWDPVFQHADESKPEMYIQRSPKIVPPADELPRLIIIEETS